MTTATIEKQVVKVGDIFYTSWGYDQTNVEFFKVVRATEKSIWVQETGQIISGSKYDYWQTSSNGEALVREYRDHETGEVVKKIAPIEIHRIQYSGGVPCFTINSFSNGYFWDGKPKHASTGH